MAKRTHVVLTKTTAIRHGVTTAQRERITYGVYLDLDDLDELARKASTNKSRKAKDGPVHVEIHSIEPVA